LAETSRGRRGIYSGGGLGEGFRVCSDIGKSDGGSRHRVRGRLPVRRLQLIGRPRLSVPRRVSGVLLRVLLLARLGRHLGMGRIGAPGLFFLFLFVFNFLFCFLFYFVSFAKMVQNNSNKFLYSSNILHSVLSQ
jgi:hypothetical protein